MPLQFQQAPTLNGTAGTSTEALSMVLNAPNNLTSNSPLLPINTFFQSGNGTFYTTSPNPAIEIVVRPNYGTVVGPSYMYMGCARHCTAQGIGDVPHFQRSYDMLWQALFCKAVPLVLSAWTHVQFCIDSLQDANGYHYGLLEFNSFTQNTTSTGRRLQSIVGDGMVEQAMEDAHPSNHARRLTATVTTKQSTGTTKQSTTYS